MAGIFTRFTRINKPTLFDFKIHVLDVTSSYVKNTQEVDEISSCSYLLTVCNNLYGNRVEGEAL
jgi:hypothetical protein